MANLSHDNFIKELKPFIAEIEIDLDTHKITSNTNSFAQNLTYKYNISFQNNFKSIQKGIQNILNSDVLLKEDSETSHKKHHNYNTEDDEDSKDSSKPDSSKDSLTHGVCNKKKAKALINCFRSFAAKPK